MTVPTTWFLVADRSRVLVYCPLEGGGLERLHDFDEPAVRARASELMTGKRGRRADAGGDGRSAMDRQTSVQQTEVLRFVQDVSDWLHLAADAGDFDALVLVAGSQMLGELRESLTTPVTQRLVDTLDKVYTKTPVADFEVRLREHFPDRMPEKVDHVPASARRGGSQPSS